MSESRDTDRFPAHDRRPSVSSLIILAMCGSRVLQLEQNNCGYAHDGLHCCISRTSNVCDVSATYDDDGCDDDDNGDVVDGDDNSALVFYEYGHVRIKRH